MYLSLVLGSTYPCFILRHLNRLRPIRFAYFLLFSEDVAFIVELSIGLIERKCNIYVFSETFIRMLRTDGYILN